MAVVLQEIFYIHFLEWKFVHLNFKFIQVVQLLNVDNPLPELSMA